MKYKQEGHSGPESLTSVLFSGPEGTDLNHLVQETRSIHDSMNHRSLEFHPYITSKP